MRRTSTTVTLVATLAALVLAGCAPQSSGGSSGSGTASSSCAAGKLATHKSGVLTVATDNPAYEPWFSDN